MAKSNILYRSKLKKVKQFIDNRAFDEADKILTQLVRKAPRESETWLYKGYVEGFRNNHVEAAICFKKALDIKPANPSILYNYGVALRDSGDLKTAVDVFEKSIQKDPDNTTTLGSLAHVCFTLGDFDKAAEAYDRSLKIDGRQPEAHSNLGSIYQAQGQLKKAEQCYRKALEINPAINNAENLGSVLVSQGRFEDSITVFRDGLKKQPNNTRLFSNYLLTLNYLDNMTQLEMFKEHRLFGDAFDCKNPATSPGPVLSSGQRIRIGYCSPDFREHSVAFFIEPIFDQYDRETYEVFVYNLSPKEDDVTRRLREKVDHWRDVAMDTPIDVSGRIMRDDIHILVDLSGHTAHNSLLSFAQRPSPIQMTYLGYPNTTGMDSIQYRLTDNFADPAGQDEYYTETLLRLPDTFLCYRPDDDAPVVSEPPCLSKGYVTFGSFNNLSKINNNVIALWSKILLAIEGSKLLVKNPSLTDEKTRDDYYALFEEHGVNRDNIRLVGHTKTRFDHLSLYNEIDVSLDTFPYNGTTTTCEALWMGVPVVVLEGERHSGRVGVSLLMAAGCQQWIASSDEEYISIATRLAANVQGLKSTRYDQRKKLSGSTLCDADKFTSSLEDVYKSIVGNVYTIEH